jgi:hypothetical protein
LFTALSPAAWTWTTVRSTVMLVDDFILLCRLLHVIQQKHKRR